MIVSLSQESNAAHHNTLLLTTQAYEAEKRFGAQTLLRCDDVSLSHYQVIQVDIALTTVVCHELGYCSFALLKTVGQVLHVQGALAQT